MEMTVPSGSVTFGPITTWRRERGQRGGSRRSRRSPGVTSANSSQVTYVIRQDTAFIQPHACFHLDAVADNGLTDHHVTFDMNIIPDVGVFQLDVVTCWNGKKKEASTPLLHLYVYSWPSDCLDWSSPMVQLLPMTLLEMLQLAPMLVLQPIRTFSSIWLPWPRLTPDPR